MLAMVPVVVKKVLRILVWKGTTGMCSGDIPGDSHVRIATGPIIMCM